MTNRSAGPVPAGNDASGDRGMIEKFTASDEQRDTNVVGTPVQVPNAGGYKGSGDVDQITKFTKTKKTV